jgi:uncharacterized membrane protein YbhN (UPF0104 family)
MKAWLAKNRSLALRLFGTILTLVLLVWLISQRWQEIAEALQRLPFLNLLAAIVLTILSRLFVMARWHVLLRSGGVPISFKETIKIVFTGLFASNFLPTTIGGDVVRLAGVIQMGYDRAVCLASIAADRLINMGGMVLMAPLGVWQVFQAGTLPALGMAGIWQKGLDFARRTLQSFSLWIKKPQALFGAFAFALAHIFCTFITMYFLLQGMGHPVSVWKIAGLSSLAYFVTLMPISINGYGVNELTVTFLYSQIGGVSVSVSATAALISRILNMLASLPGALFLPGIMAKMDGSEKNEA